MTHLTYQPTLTQTNQRTQFTSDLHRPRFHFLPPENWMNDPNGLIQWRGRYHMFYQHNPDGAFWANMHWGHAVSDDLVHWHDLPIALAPTPGGSDEAGCFSGCAVDHDGVPTLIYTGVRNGIWPADKQAACIATSYDDNLLTWTKHNGNPVIRAPQGQSLLGFRDHCVWREGQSWYQVIGSGIEGEGGALFLYRSPDLRTWEYAGPLLTAKDITIPAPYMGTMWECPQLIAFDDYHALLLSVWDEDALYTVYLTGTLQDHCFIPETAQKLDYGNRYFYAPQALRDNQGRWLMWGWIPEGRSIASQKAAGWAGVMSLPRMLTPGADRQLHCEPAPEITQLRGEQRHFANLSVRGDYMLPDVESDMLDIEAEITPGSAAQVGLILRRTLNGNLCASGQMAGEETRIYYDAQANELRLERTNASRDTDQEPDLAPLAGPLTLVPGETLRLRVLLDRSVIEVFANGRACLTGRIYPSHTNSLGTGVFAQGGTAKVQTLDAWQMNTIWP